MQTAEFTKQNRQEAARAASPNSQVLDSILQQGAYFVISRFEKQEHVLALTHAALLDGVESLQGSSARRKLEVRGFQALHEVLPAEQIGMLRDFVMPRIRPGLLALACAVGRKVLGIEGEFFVDDYTILRINYPYSVAMKAGTTAENPGIGRGDGQSKANKVVDPVYDPKGYHNHEPPPAWAHGPHQDTWTGHSRWGVNLWWAIEDVPEECSMVFYPQTFGRHLEPDPRSLYLKAGQPLPKPVKMALRRGEMLVFNPEMLHGTHLNTSSYTRLALSSRLNPRRPKFDPSCFYAREFWHSSANLEAQCFDRIVRFPRAENLDSEAPAPEAACITQPAVVRPISDAVIDGWRQICSSDRIRAGEKIQVRLDGWDILITRGESKLHAVQARCAHLNVSLADGYHDDHNIWCPAHAVAFSLGSGRSSCESLRLRTFELREEDGMVWLRAETKEAEKPRAFAVHPLPSRPRLTVNILTRDSEERLKRLLPEVASFADEVLVGVDAASVDGTLDTAAKHADVVYRFKHEGQLAAARMLPFEYASGNWILSLDDDESMEESFDGLVAALLSDTRATHYWFPRKWIVNMNPCEYLHAAPWFPDWQLRLFRNDPSLVWKPPQPHSGYSVQGPGFYEERASVLHFEPLFRSSEARAAKLKQYREMGGKPGAEVMYSYTPETPRRATGLRGSATAPVRFARHMTHEGPESRVLWRSAVTKTEVPHTALAGEEILAEVHVRNTGSLAWAPYYGGRSARVQLGYHLLGKDGDVLRWDSPRFPVLRVVAPGDTGIFWCSLAAPAEAGEYLLEWDMVSEDECWFADRGGRTQRTPLLVL